MNLSNHFLIAMPSLDDPMFEGSLVYLCEHNSEGATGVIVNKPSPINMEVVFAATGKATPPRFRSEYVMVGGPVQTERGFVLHTPVGHWQSSLKVNDHLALTTSRDIIENMDGDAVQDVLLTIGCSLWTGGQLERELAKNSWLTVAADEDILFKLPAHKRYDAALSKLGIRSEMLSGAVGHA